MPRELSEDEIADLTKPSSHGKPSYIVPGTTKRVKYDPEIRTVQNWFKLPHTMQGECEVPFHDEEREPREKPRMFFRHEPNAKFPEGMLSCRWCFLEQRDRL